MRVMRVLIIADNKNKRTGGMCMAKFDDGQALLMQLYDRYAPMILALTHVKMPGQDAEDVLGAVMLRLMHNLDRLEELQEPQRKAYVYVTARSEIADRLRKRARERNRSGSQEEAERVSDPTADVEQVLIDHETVNRLRRAVRTLPEEHRALLEMRYALEMDASEIARRTGKNCDTVRQQLMRLRRKLKRLMLEEE